MTLKTICNREVLIASKNDSILEAARLMREYHAGDVVIVEERNGMRYPVGILTDRDIVVELIAKNIGIDSVTVGDLMCRDVLFAQEDDDVLDAIKMMRQKGIRRLPVVDKAGALVGIVTVDDLIDMISEQLSDIVGIIGREQMVEKKYR